MSKDLGAWSKELGAKSWEQGAGRVRKGLRVWSIERGAGRNEPKGKNQVNPVNPACPMECSYLSIPSGSKIKLCQTTL